ncbi:hypothetical protein DYBT9275_03717 [Dyadobacter sp. CECT 9275]|uniref:Type I restriction enzyme endonuclease subunit n=1 Tax=Dyadobacter helix TaxID=2822344 RepID=A0A916NMD9_9BACT|nr:HsdR family type I site-specific deoxyribonuclease [Dyadobacter sp. CECT 9275]CAG5006059.1 hypothetical protein DYBT9275_03717 [Dyadobacter sp. CECT 9275]
MSKPGEEERIAQDRIVKLFQQQLGYRYLGNLKDTEENSNVNVALLTAYLTRKGYNATLISKALFELKKAATINAGDNLYPANRAVYSLLRYGIPVKEEAGKNKETVHLIDWENASENDFAIAEEVSVKGANNKRPDIVLYLNGIAIGVLELKKAGTSVTQAIRQNLDNQAHLFIKPFFTTVQLVLAGNDSAGLYYGTTLTKEKYFLKWKEDNDVYNPDENVLDKHLIQFCSKERVLDIINHFVIFDKGTKKLCRPNQYFGVKEAQRSLLRREGGIIWHTQGSGKSLTMVWLAKWILENKPLGVEQRVLVITDRTELDEQIEGVFNGVGETIVRTKSGADLIQKLNVNEERLLCSLIHKFSGREDSETASYIAELKIPKDFSAKGQFVVFIDECHRTNSGDLHKAMKELLPENAVFIGFTGTPLLKADKKKSIEIFGKYIHTYKFDEAVKDGVVLDLLYEARDVDQHVLDQKGVDQWFETVTKGMNDLPKAELKQKWGTMQKVLSTKSRLEKIVFDIRKDFLFQSRLKDGKGNAMLVARSIYEACRYYEIFQSTGLKKCAIITSYVPTISSIKLEETGEGETEKKEQYETYQKMLRDYGYTNAEDFEKFAKKEFKDHPAQMQLLIVVDKLLTGFDAIHCTYLYIDKQMQDHGLFQAICRTNRLGAEEEGDPHFKEFGYIVDYKNLFGKLEKSISDYTSDAFDAFEEEDIKGLLTDRHQKNKERLDDALEALHQLCEPVAMPKHNPQYFHYFCGNPSNKEELKEREEKRLTFYKLVVALIRAYNNIAGEMAEAGFTPKQAATIKQQVYEYTQLRNSIKEYSGDYIDLKRYEPDMRQMLDMYLTADPSRVLSKLGDASLLQLIVENGIEYATGRLSDGIKHDKQAVAETIENNMRRTIIQEMPINPAYYEKMSVLLLELIRLRKEGAIDYEESLKRYEDLAKEIQPEAKKDNYPTGIDTQGKRALYDNLDKEEKLALLMDEAVIYGKHDNWIGHSQKEKHLKNQVVKPLLEQYHKTEKLDPIIKIIKQQTEYK